MATKSLVLTVGLLVAIGGLLFWRIQDTRARAERLESQILKRLSVEDINLIIKSQALSDPQAATVMKEDPNARQAMLKNLRGVLALAAAARREGLSEENYFKINVEFKKNFLLQNLYMAKLNSEQGKAFYKPEEILAVWNNPDNEVRFRKDIETLEAIQRVYSESRGTSVLTSQPGEKKLEKARKDWARTKVFSDKAKADAAFMQQPEVQLRLKIVEAGILASDYLNKHWRKAIRASSDEISAYLASHPEFDLIKKRQKAEMVLRRAKAGEDFIKLVKEFSEDRRTNGTGGLYENVAKDTLWPEVETAALVMEHGQIADKLIESHTGFHIVRLESKQVKKESDGRETVKFSLRHILLQKAFAEPGNNRPDIPPPFMTPEEIAKAEVEKEKYAALVKDLIERNQITVPDEFS